MYKTLTFALDLFHKYQTFLHFVAVMKFQIRFSDLFSKSANINYTYKFQHFVLNAGLSSVLHNKTTKLIFFFNF